MIRFARLFGELDEAARPNEQSAALERYFATAPAMDAAWALGFLLGMKTPRALKNGQLREWIAGEADLPSWLVDESCETVGDVAETLALLLPDPEAPTTDGPLALHRLMTERVIPLAGLGEEARRDLVVATWRELNAAQRCIWNKLITGSFRIDVARTLAARALGRVAGVSASVMANRILGFSAPNEDAFLALLAAESPDENFRPYPFHMAGEIHDPERQGAPPVEGPGLFPGPDAAQPHGPTLNRAEELGSASDWQAEWLLGGLSAQVIRRGDAVLIWSQEGDLLTTEFPEIADAAKSLPDGTVLVGEIVVWPEGDSCPRPFADARQGLSKGLPGAGLLRRLPAVFIARDILEAGGDDQRGHPLHARRRRLDEVLSVAAGHHRGMTSTIPAPGPATGSQMDLFAAIPCPTSLPLPPCSFRLRASSPVSFASWGQLASLRLEARKHGAAGVVLKRRESPYGDGNASGDWWIWRTDPQFINAVLIAALPSRGNGSRPFSDYTFAVWNKGELVPIGKTGIGLPDGGVRALDDFIRAHITGKFGPVRSVKPELVFELEFDSVQASTRHKSGLLVRSARIRRRRPDLSAAEADTLDALRLLLDPTSS